MMIDHVLVKGVICLIPIFFSHLVPSYSPHAQSMYLFAIHKAIILFRFDLGHIIVPNFWKTIIVLSMFPLEFIR